METVSFMCVHGHVTTKEMHKADKWMMFAVVCKTCHPEAVPGYVFAPETNIQMAQQIPSRSNNYV